MYTSEVTYGNNIKKRLVDFMTKIGDAANKKFISSEYFVDIKEIKQILISICTYSNCSRSRRRAEKVDKRM